MTGKERVVAAANRRKTDKPPTSLRCTSEAAEALMEYLGVPTYIDALDKMEVDLRWIGVPYIGPKERGTPTLGGEGTDIWGNGMKAAKNQYNTYFEIVHHPLAKCESVDEIMSYDWPSLDWFDYSGVKEEIKANKKTDDRAIMFFAGRAFETPWYMRGQEQFFMDMMENPEIINAICSKVREFYYQRALRVIDAADGEIDVIGSGADIGGQQSLMLSPDMWREQIKPHSAGLVRPFRDMGLCTFHHSCGSVDVVIDDYVDIGIQILDPIQVSAAGMRPEGLFTRFGDRISFHGALDVVELLPKSTAQEVYDETMRMISVLGGNYGYFVSPTHQIQGDTPPENVAAIYQAARDYGVR